MTASLGTRKLVGALGFVMFGFASAAVGMESLGGALLLVPGLASWLLFAQATLADHEAKAAAAPRELRGIARAKVARALVASLFIPGTGHLVLGWSRTRACALAVSFIGVAAAAIAQLIPEWAGIALAALPWVTAQAELRYRTGWTWPLVPRFGDLFPPEPNEPAAFAHADRPAGDDPRRGWRGRE